jgi:hypothetical protein
MWLKCTAWFDVLNDETVFPSITVHDVAYSGAEQFAGYNPIAELENLGVVTARQYVLLGMDTLLTAYHDLDGNPYQIQFID